MSISQGAWQHVNKDTRKLMFDASKFVLEKLMPKEEKSAKDNEENKFRGWMEEMGLLPKANSEREGVEVIDVSAIEAAADGGDPEDEDQRGESRGIGPGGTAVPPVQPTKTPTQE